MAICKRDLFIRQRDLCVYTIENFIYIYSYTAAMQPHSAKEANVYVQKRRMSLYKRDLFICKRDPYVCTTESYSYVYAL